MYRCQNCSSQGENIKIKPCTIQGIKIYLCEDCIKKTQSHRGKFASNGAEVQVPELIKE